VTWYNLLSNQFSGLNAIVVPGTLRDSLVLLALLLEQETELEPMEFMTDTAAYSDAVFGLFWLLGYQFSPRLADLGDAKLWRIDRKADYGPFNSLGKGTINLALIRDNWPDLIRLAGSLKLGHLKAAGIMRTLQVRDKPTTLARALSEIGRVAKTIHILRYIDDPAFRRRILTQLNHTELRHRLGRRIHHGERGEIRSPLQQGQEEQLGSLGLALNVVVHWNAIYMQEAIQQLRLGGIEVRNDDVSHLSPLIWRHLNFLGRYDFSLPDTVMNGGLRPLRNPTCARSICPAYWAWSGRFELRSGNRGSVTAVPCGGVAASPRPPEQAAASTRLCSWRTAAPLVVGDAGEPAAQFDRGRQLAIPLIGGADRGCIGFGDDEHGWEDGRGRCAGQGHPIRWRVTAGQSACNPTDRSRGDDKNCA
jgi:TnpA family transposase